MPYRQASVRTRVVSWKEAAEIQLSVLRALLVMPRRSGRALAGLPRLLHDLLVLRLEDELVDLLVDQEVGVPDLLDLDPAEHHPDDRLDVLVVDRDALEPVDRLDLLEEVLGQLLLPEDAEDVVRIDRPVLRASPARIRSPSETLRWAPFGMRYSFSPPRSFLTVILR